MFRGNERGYFASAASGLRCIRIAMTAAGMRSPTTILDFPCGHGRVLRMLSAAFPRACLTACDVDRDGVDFCARLFGATPAYALDDPRETKIEGSFDLIWVGSLLTHFDTDRWSQFLALLSSALAPGGLLVFTTHGRHVAATVSAGRERFGLSEETCDTMLRDYRQQGFGYADFPTRTGVGISLSSPAWVCNRLAEEFPRLELLTYTERAYGANRLQDSIGCVLPHQGTDFEASSTRDAKA
jgi:SAM-dependent methyltransferase